MSRRESDVGNKTKRKLHAELTSERLQYLLNYDIFTGIFTRRSTITNATNVGDVAGGNHIKGYISISVDGKVYLAHRLAWLYVYGDFPSIGIDHIDRNKKNNSISNLRLANGSENQTNTGIRKDNTSSFKGVAWDKTRNKWISYININGKRINIGRYSELSHAVKERQLVYEKINTKFIPINYFS